MTSRKVTSTFESPLDSPVMTAEERKMYSEVTIDNKKIFHCLIPDCGKAFKFLSEMKRHLTVHSKQRPFVCSFPECGKTFKRADALSNHFRIHSRNTPFNCTEEGCEAQFVTKSALRYHMLKHNGERTYKCNYDGCDKAFMTQAQLKQHEKASVYHQRINGGNSPSVDESAMSPKEMRTPFEFAPRNEKEGQAPESNDGSGKSDFLSYDHNMEGATNEEDGENFNYFEQIYGQVNHGYDETSSVETNDLSPIEKLKKRGGDPALLNMLSFIMEENRQLKKKLKTLTEVPSYNAPPVLNNNNNYQPIQSQGDVDSFFRNTNEIVDDQDPFLNFQPTFLY